MARFRPNLGDYFNLDDAEQGLQVWELPADVAEQVRANWRRN